MATPVVTIASGGLPVVDVTASKPNNGKPVTEAANGFGIPVTKVTPVIGGAAATAVTYVTVAIGNP
jgi:hypothetical protein